MKALIIGGAGFVARYLIRELKASDGVEIHATILPGEEITDPDVHAHILDVRESAAMLALLEQVQPQRIYHLAAVSSVKQSWAQPQLAVDVNITGTLNLLQALRELHSDARVLLIGSSEEYGFAGRENSVLSESVTPIPGNIYAVTKCTQNMLASVYAKAYGLALISVRAFNHIGGGQSPQFVTADFCRQVARIEAGLAQPVINVGNLEAARDFCDVRDIVRAYTLLIEAGNAGETYNIGSGHAVRIREVLEQILTMAKIPIEVRVDPQKLRPLDIPSTRADIGKLTAICDWQPRYTLRQSLQAVLDDWRARVAPEGEEEQT